MLRTQFTKFVSALPSKKQTIAQSVFPTLGRFSNQVRLYANENTT